MNELDVAPRLNRHAVLRFRRSQLEIGPKVWWAVALAAALIIGGIAYTPTNPIAGAAIGVAGVVGAILGSLLQATPIPRDYTPEAISAVRGLLTVAQTIEDTQTLATQLARQKTNGLVQVGLVTVQDELVKLRIAVYEAMGEWDAVSPGAVAAVERLQHAGSAALARLSRETTES